MVNLGKNKLANILLFSFLILLLMSIMIMNKNKLIILIKKNESIFAILKSTKQIYSKAVIKTKSKLIKAKTDSNHQKLKYIISIDANKSFICNRFWGAVGQDSFNDGILKPHNQTTFKLMEQANKNGRKVFTYVRACGMFADQVSHSSEDIGGHVYKEQNGKIIYDWRIVDKVIDFILDRGLIPIVQLTYMPDDLASDINNRNDWNNANVSPPKDYLKWKNLIYETVNHLKIRYGAEEIKKWYFEVWNEPDLPFFFWVEHPNKEKYPNRGDDQEYQKLYDFAVAGALEACNDIKIGGTAIAGDIELFIQNWLLHCTTGINHATGNKGTRVNFISRHSYGPIDGIISDVKNFINSAKIYGDKIFNDLEFLITETGPSTHPKYYLNSRYTAAWVIKQVDAFLHLKLRYGSEYVPDVLCFWTLPTPVNFEDHFGLVSVLGNEWNPPADAVVKRPVFNAFEALGYLSNEFLNVIGSEFNEPVRGIATKNTDGSISIIVYHLDEYDYVCENKNHYNVAINVDNVELSDVYVAHYAINENYSNGHSRWKQLGFPTEPTAGQLKDIQDNDDLMLVEPIYQYKINNNKFEKTINIQSNSVALLILARVNDHIPPHDIEKIHVINTTSNSIELSWPIPSPAKDGDTPSSYLILRDKIFHAKTFNNNYIDSCLYDDTIYHYEIFAVDKQGNISKKSITKSIRTNQDTVAPFITAFRVINATTIEIKFSESIKADVFENTETILIEPKIKILQLDYDYNNNKLVVTTSEHKKDSKYKMYFKDLKDTSKNENPIKPDYMQYEYVIKYQDLFNINTIYDYDWKNTFTQGGLGTARILTEKSSLDIMTGDDVAGKLGRWLPESKSGMFEIAFQPYKAYPEGGSISIRLIQDEMTYIELVNTNGYGPGFIQEVINSIVTNKLNFSHEYEQNKKYNLKILFDNNQISASGFGDILSLTGTKPITIRAFEIELSQQDAYFDNIYYESR